MPEIPDFELKNISVEDQIKNRKKDIDNSLEQIAEKHERFIPLSKKRKSKLGDLVLFDYEGTINNKSFEGSSGKDETVVLGSKKYIPGYEEQMVGTQIGENKKINVVFPDDYRVEENCRKKGNLNLKIKDIQERVKNVKIDDKLAEEVGEKKSSIKRKIEERMNKDFENLSALKMRREATEKMLKNLILIYQQNG